MTTRWSPSMPYSLAIFDLDGTLVDSFPWFLRTITDVADRFGFRPVGDEEARARRARRRSEDQVQPATRRANSLL